MTWKVAIVEVGVLPGCRLAAYVPGAPADVTLDLPCYCWLLRGAGAAVLVLAFAWIVLRGWIMP